MFKVAKKKEVEWPVTVSIPQDGGKVTKATFTAKFEVVDSDESEDILFGRNPDCTDILDRVLIGFSGVAFEDGTPMEFSTESKATLLKIPYARQALLDAFFALQKGQGARKN